MGCGGAQACRDEGGVTPITCTCQDQVPCPGDASGTDSVDTAKVTVYFVAPASKITVYRHDRHGDRHHVDVPAGFEIVTNLEYQIAHRLSCPVPPPPPPPGTIPPPPGANVPTHQCAMFRPSLSTPLSSGQSWSPKEPASCPNVQANPVQFIKSTSDISNVLNAAITSSVSAAQVARRQPSPCHEVSASHMCS